jgi:hypothetical protein
VTPVAHEPAWQRGLFVGLVVGGAVWLVLALGYFFRWDWATATWPWPDGRLSYIFVSSILAAIGAASIWIGLSRKLSSLAAGALGLAVMTGGPGGYFIKRAIEDSDGALAAYGIGCAAVSMASLVVFAWAHRLPVVDERRTPIFLRGSYVIFWGILVVIGLSMIFGRDEIMPWPVRDDTAVLIGWIFFADSFYFLYGLWRPYWEHSFAQLWSFLAYDLVLIIPFVRHLNEVPSNLELNLWIYIGVLLFSAGLSIYYIVRWYSPGRTGVRKDQLPANR